MRFSNRNDSLQDAVSQVLDGYRDTVAAAYLFGSTVKGDVAALSDVDIADLLAAGTSTEVPDPRFRLHVDLCRALKRNDVDLLILNTAKNLIIKDEIVRNGRLLFEGNAEQREAFELEVIHSCIDFKRQRKMAVGY